MAVSKSGKFFAWGRGVNGQLGVGDTTDQNSPMEIVELSSETLLIDELKKQSHPVVMHSIPAADRYALVPDPAVQGDVATVPDQSDAKRLKR